MATIYHYTSGAGICGILSKDRIWATSFLFRNDYSELTYGLTQFCKEILRISRVQGREFDVLPEALAHRLQTPLVNAAHPFSVSFCKHADERLDRNGLLSQWRAYGADGGYAIGFDEDSLIERSCDYAKGFMNNEKTSTVGWYIPDNCSYDAYEAPEDVEKNDEILDFIHSLLTTDIEKRDDINENRFDLLKEATRVALFFKHQDFFEEREFRIAYGLLKRNVHADLDFIENRGSIFPHINLFGEAGISDLVRRIVIGPHIDAERRARSLELLLRCRGLNGIDVSISDTPLRK